MKGWLVRLVLHLPAMFWGAGFVVMVVVKPSRVVWDDGKSICGDSRDTSDTDDN